MTQLNDRLFETSLYVQAAVVDPRFKMFPFLDEGKRDEAYINVCQLADHSSAAQTSAELLRELEKYAHPRTKMRNPHKKRRKVIRSVRLRYSCV